MMRNFKLIELALFVIGYVFISIILLFLDNSGLSIWLGINVTLAIIPLFIITLTNMWMSERDYKVDFVAVVLFIGFVFFLPNTFYVITDFIHIDSGDFYTNIIISYGHDSQVYMNNIQPYILLMHIVVSMFISVLAGIKGLLIFEEILVNKKIKILHSFIAIVFLLFLSAVGIFIGRFIRLFSWDVLNPFNVVKSLIDHLDGFGIMFILLFFFVQMLLYYGYKFLFFQKPTS